MDSRPIDPSDLLGLQEYGVRRAEIRAQIIALKSLRRVEVGPWISLVYEDRRTVLYQIQEMLHVERISKPEAVRHEIETYSELLPVPGELSATLFIEIPDAALREAALSSLGGIEKTVALRVGEVLVLAVDKRPIDPAVERPGRASAVYYLAFPLDKTSAEAFVSGQGEIWVEVQHPRYRHAAALRPETRASLSEDLATM